jgi:p-cumate 2,3-dioxygenase alpha subunit
MAAPLKKVVDNDRLVDDDREGQRFRVSRSAFVSKEILALERANIFDKVWLYLGHESELVKPGDFLTRSVGGRTLLFTRDNKNKFHALMNTCPHRGARVCRERSGNAKSFQCFYHGWVFGLDGALRDMPGKESYPPGFAERSTSSLQPAPKFGSYRGFCFVSFNPNVESLPDYLGNAKEYLDIVADQSEAGMTVVGGTQEYSIRANWKLLAENSFDGYHAATNHATYLEYLKGTTGGLVPIQLTGSGRDLGKGHGVVEYRAPWGRPVAQWIPAWGDDGKKRVEAIYNNLVSRHGKERADRIALYNRNLHVFPNLVINDIMALTVRTFYPAEPDFMTVNAWALAPVQEDAGDRSARLFNFLEFLGPGGFATPDDIEALEQCQEGYSNLAEAGWNDISKGLTKETPSFDDEAQMRGYWTEWNRRIYGA